MKRNILAAPVAAIAFALLTLNVCAQEKTTVRKSGVYNAGDHGFLNVEGDSIGAPVQRITTYRDGALYKIKTFNEKITELTIDGKPVAEKDFAQYEPMVKKILDQVKRDQEQAVKDREQAEKDREQAEKDRAQAELDRQQAVKDREQAEKDRQQAQKDREQAEKDREQAGRDRAQAEVDRKHAEEHRKLIASLVDDLVNEKIIASKSELVSLELSEGGLVVNDKQQSAAMFQKFKTKYLKTPKTRFSFYNGENTKRFSIDQ